MYRRGYTYDEIKQIIIDIYIDYGIKKFPIDEKEICRKMGVALVPYSSFGEHGMSILKKKSDMGFFVKESIDSPPTIYYNDIRDRGSARFTIFHELKHYVFEDDDDTDDDLADFFARYFMCPIPYLMLKNIKTTIGIMSFCDTNRNIASHVRSNIINRINKFDYELFDYEVRLIEHIEPVLIEVYKKK